MLALRRARQLQTGFCTSLTPKSTVSKCKGGQARKARRQMEVRPPSKVFNIIETWQSSMQPVCLNMMTDQNLII